MHGRSIRNGFAALARVAAGAGRRSYKRESLFRYDGVFLSVLFRLSYRGDPARLRLKSLFATADDDLEVRCEEICVMWPVCGAICGLK